MNEFDEVAYERFQTQMLPLIQRHTVSIIASYDQQIKHHATGTLVRFADHWFVVTAGHAIRDFDTGKRHYQDLTLFLDNGHNQPLVRLYGSYIATKTVRDSTDPNVRFQNDPLDIAIWELDRQTVEALTEKSFLTRKDISVTADVSSGVYFLAGFPCVWSDADKETDRFHLAAMRYIAHPHGEYEQLPNFDSRFHMALYLKQEPPMPSKFEGISGCAIWKLSDFPIADDWTSAQAQVVAVQTCVYTRRNQDAIRGTRWQWVVRTLAQLSPDLHRAFALWLPGSE